jgi:hemolysin III
MSKVLREPANALIHLIGSLLSLGALAVLIWIGVSTRDGGALVGLTVYGISQLALYSASTLHHALRISETGTEWLLRLDCTLVYVFIAGTYTPVCLITLHAGWRWGLLAVMWGMALGGLIMKLRWLHGPTWLSTMVYIAMGWAALAAMPALVGALPVRGIAWFLAGGIVYTLGALVFLLDRPWPRPGVFESHAIWHLCVVGGSACCFWAMVRYVAPLA